MDDIRGAFRQQGLVRTRDGRVLAGVIAGLGRRVGLDPWPARLVFTLLLLIIPGSQILVYPILWILMPAGDGAADAATHQARPPQSPGVAVTG
jgi:phage shock protein PspC (stress-responsive transcriptional regulator)